MVDRLAERRWLWNSFVRGFGLIGQQAVDGDGGEPLAAVEEGEFDHEGGADDFRLLLLREFQTGFHRAAGGQQVVDEQHTIAGGDGVGVDFE